jgi:hypothetical protein
MATKTKSTKLQKREAVVPFVGEEQFVVPRPKGFGQPDMEGYVMVAGTATIDVPNTPTSTGVELPTSTQTTTSTQIPVTSSGNPITTNTSTNPPTTTPTDTTTSTLPPLSTTTPPVQSDETILAQQNCTASGGAWINGVCVNNPSPKTNVTTLPNFPVWDSLDCATLKSKIAEYNATLSTSRFAQNIVDAYNTEIAKAQAIYNTKCNIAPPTPTILLPTGGIFGGGGGGGGFGAPPSDEAPPIQEAVDNKKGIFIILAIIGAVYFLTRKKK